VVSTAENYHLSDHASATLNRWQPLWTPKDAPTEKATVITEAAAPAGCCEFVRDLVDPAIDGRRCVNNTYCPKRIFADSKLFGSCPTRLEKLKDKFILRC
jgi:hypothetical protein